MRVTDERVIGLSHEAEAGTSVKEARGEYVFSDEAFYGWRTRFGGIGVAEASQGFATLTLGKIS
jgi:putative transposase